MNIDLVVFDMAGTTVHDPGAVNSCFRAALSAAGLEVAAGQVNAVMGLAKKEAIRRLIDPSRHRDLLLPRIEAIHDDFVRRMIQFYQTDAAVHEMPGTTATFVQLRESGIKVAVNSGFSRNIAQVILDRLGWEGRGLVQASVTSDEVPRGRPFPDMIRRLMIVLGVSDPKRVAKVGDTPSDLEEGTNAGCGLVVGVTQGTHTRSQLESYPHTHLIDSVADLPNLLVTVDPAAISASRGTMPLQDGPGN
jgi:phosphonatase-like hydrolase